VLSQAAHRSVEQHVTASLPEGCAQDALDRWLGFLLRYHAADRFPYLMEQRGVEKDRFDLALYAFEH
jgi:hypothetical protein